jgi:hypothetical protein
MQSNVRRLAGSVAGRRTNNVLIAGQIALTLLPLAGAGAAMEVGLMHKPLGYDPRHVMSVGIPLHDGAYTTWAARATYFEQMGAKVAETPGVTMAAISSNATPPRNGGKTQFEILEKPSAEEQMTSVNLVSPGYFAILRIPLLEIREMQPAPAQVRVHVTRVEFDPNDGIPADAQEEISAELRRCVFKPDADSAYQKDLANEIAEVPVGQAVLQ